MSTRTCTKCHQSFPLDVTFCPQDGTSLNDVQLKAGLEIESYTLEKRIGIGGMGEVWSAYNAKIKRRAAIKFLSKRMSSNRDIVTRFLNEARAANSIQQRNIIDIFSFGELSDGRPYFIMEFLVGESLKDRLKRGPMPLSDIAEIMPGICKALQATHDQGIIHRDLKPDNIFLILEEGEKPFPKVLDFGIAKIIDIDADGNDKGSTKTSTMMGTALYMSPEQCRGAKRLDHRADIYSLGIILFEMLTGRTPFENKDEEGFGGILTRHMYVPAPVPSTMVTGRKIPDEVETVVLKMLSKKPEQRHQSCKEFLGDLLIAIGKFKSESAKDLVAAKANFDVNFETTENIKKQTLDLTSMAPSDAQVNAVPVAGTVVLDKNSASIHAEIADAALPAPQKRNYAVIGVVALFLVGLVFVLFPKNNEPARQPVTQTNTAGIKPEPTPAEPVKNAIIPASTPVAPTSVAATPTEPINPKVTKTGQDTKITKPTEKAAKDPKLVETPPTETKTPIDTTEKPKEPVKPGRVIDPKDIGTTPQ